MTSVISKNKEVKSCLRDLVALVEINGGFVHPSVEFVVAENGELSAISKLPESDNETIIYIPDECLPSTDDFSIRLENNEIKVQSVSDSASDLQAEIFRLHIRLLNLTDKISFHRQTLPDFALADAPEIMGFLFESGQDASPFSELRDNRSDEWTLTSFWNSRVANYMTKEGAVRKNILMPVIDILNHNVNSPALQSYPGYDNYTGLSIINSKPLRGSDECFYRYNRNDALRCYLHYGFLDTNVEFVRSRKMEIDLPGIGKLIINAQTPGTDVPKIHPSVADLINYFPFMSEIEPKVLEISHLLIPPPEAILSLRRILNYLILVLVSEENKIENIGKVIEHAEEVILTDNENYYKKLGQLLASANGHKMMPGAHEMLNRLVLRQLELISHYRDSISKYNFHSPGSTIS